jgi:hypothetical protein
MSYLPLLLGFGVPAALAALLPRGWAVAAIMLWLVSPVLLYVGVAAFELATRPPVPDAAGTALYGLLLVASVVGLPWLLLGLAGGIAGTAIRRQRLARQALPAPAAAPVPTETGSASLPAGSAPSSRLAAPDGSVVVDFAAVEWGNTLWVRSPRIVACDSGRVLLDLWGSDWDAEVAFPAPATSRLALRRFRTGASALIDIDVAGDRFVPVVPPGSAAPPALPLAALPAWLDGRPAAPAAPPRPRGAFAAWRSALLILVVAAAAIAAGSWWTLQRGAPATQRFDPPPRFVPPR